MAINRLIIGQYARMDTVDDTPTDIRDIDE